MKKLLIAVFVVLMGLAFTVPSFAIENTFGGYWRVRMVSQQDFDGTDDNVGNLTRADTRTRLYYTAKINDNLKFVNKFEMNAIWGAGSYGDLGADGNSVLVKNSYVDFNYGPANIKLGTQGAVLHRSFLFDTDFSGIVVSANGLTGLYAKIDEDATAGNTGDDAAMYSLIYSIDLDTVKLTPAFTYIDDADGDNLYYIGLDVDANLGAASVWGTFIYNGGEITTAGISNDVSAWLAAAGMTFKISDTLSLHGQAFYATGDDDGTGDKDDFQIYPDTGSYYWSEIMGKGIFDEGYSNGSCADVITNITALNIGASFAPMDKLTLSLDLWYAMLNENTPADDAAGLDEALGFEVDVVASYKLIDGLTLDVVGAYLFADDATTDGVADDANPWEVGTRLSLSF